MVAYIPSGVKYAHGADRYHQFVYLEIIFGKTELWNQQPPLPVVSSPDVPKLQADTEKRARYGTIPATNGQAYFLMPVHYQGHGTVPPAQAQAVSQPSAGLAAVPSAWAGGSEPACPQGLER
jgi:hypothetical protein